LNKLIQYDLIPSNPDKDMFWLELAIFHLLEDTKIRKCNFMENILCRPSYFIGVQRLDSLPLNNGAMCFLKPFFLSEIEHHSYDDQHHCSQYNEVAIFCF